MNESELKALQLTQHAVLGLINDVAERADRERPQELMIAAEVAQVLRMSLSRFYHVHTEIGLTPVRRFGRKLLFKRAEVTRLLDLQEPKKKGRPPNRIRPAAGAHFDGTFLGLQA